MKYVEALLVVICATGAIWYSDISITTSIVCLIFFVMVYVDRRIDQMEDKYEKLRVQKSIRNCLSNTTG